MDTNMLIGSRFEAGTEMISPRASNRARCPVGESDALVSCLLTSTHRGMSHAK